MQYITGNKSQTMSVNITYSAENELFPSLTNSPEH